MRYISTFLIVVGLSILIFIFWPVAKEEIKYNFNQISRVQYIVGDEQLNTFVKPLTPPNTDFSIIIPKIGATAPVIANVDPADPKKYLSALKKGVAHAAGTGIPDEVGNVYIFAHSTDAFWNVNKYNAVFYLIGKLKTGDEIYIYYQNRLITYQVYDKRVVSADSPQYLDTLVPGEKTLTLQTCYPPGTTFERLIVLAKQTSP